MSEKSCGSADADNALLPAPVPASRMAAASRRAVAASAGIKDKRLVIFIVNPSGSTAEPGTESENRDTNPKSCKTPHTVSSTC